MEGWWVANTPPAKTSAGESELRMRMARFQINFTSGIIMYPPEEIEGSYNDAKEFAESRLKDYAPGTRYHIRMWRMDPLYPNWVPCDDPDFLSC